MDPATGIGIPVAFGAGLVSFLSPCVLPLVPGYISAVAGVGPNEIRPRRVIGPSLAFVASFSVIFIVLGLLGEQALRGALTGPTALKVIDKAAAPPTWLSKALREMRSLPINFLSALLRLISELFACHSERSEACP